MLGQQAQLRQGAQAQFGQQMTGLGQSVASAGAQDVANLQAIGGQQQTLNQAQLDAQRNALLQAQQAPMQQYQSLLPFVQLAGQQTGPSQIGTEFTPSAERVASWLRCWSGNTRILGQLFWPRTTGGYTAAGPQSRPAGAEHTGPTGWRALTRTATATATADSIWSGDVLPRLSLPYRNTTQTSRLGCPLHSNSSMGNIKYDNWKSTNRRADKRIQRGRSISGN